MSRVLASLLLIMLFLVATFSPVLAADELPEPFCGDLDEEDCALLRESSAAMLDLTSYTTAVEYKVLQHGIPELPPESEAVVRIEGQYAFDRRARESMRTLAIISRDEPLAAVQKLGESPDLLINLYDGMTADLFVTLDLSQSWTHLLEEEADLEWPDTTTVEVRLVDGVLYFDISELKPLIPELAESEDWVGVELVEAMIELADRGEFAQVAADVAASSEGRSVWGLDPTMLNLITTMRATFGRPEQLWPYMEIRRLRDVELADQAGAHFQTDFAALDFILSDDFRDLLTQVAAVAASEGGSEVDQQELDSALGFFWFLAPSLFRDLEISGVSTIGLDDHYQHAGETIFHWGLTTVIQAIATFAEEDLGDISDDVYIDYSTSFENSAFNERITVKAPAAAQILPLDSAAMDELLGNGD